MSEIPVLALEVVIKTMLCQLLCLWKRLWVGQDKLGQPEVKATCCPGCGEFLGPSAEDVNNMKDMELKDIKALREMMAAL